MWGGGGVPGVGWGVEWGMEFGCVDHGDLAGKQAKRCNFSFQICCGGPI